jgi:hypothetical protein
MKVSYHECCWCTIITDKWTTFPLNRTQNRYRTAAQQCSCYGQWPISQQGTQETSRELCEGPWYVALVAAKGKLDILSCVTSLKSSSLQDQKKKRCQCTQSYSYIEVFLSRSLKGVWGNQRKLLRPINVSRDINMNRLQEIVLEDALQISGVDW